MAIFTLIFSLNNQLLAESTIDFARDVRPILADNCLQCHGPDDEQRQGDLRLDRAEDAAQVISATDMDQSELINRVTSSDPDEVMPPPDSKKKLTADQIQTLKSWLAQGAKWDSHWSFEPITRPRLPQLNEQHSDVQSWIRNPIDAFVLAKLKAKNISPSPTASRRTLIRRAYIDLIGLLPSPTVVQSFLNDKRRDAYENLIENLLANPRLGERWGRHWLDQARYADSNGYAPDGNRVMWPYRDWVISAQNQDMPFDQFTIEQLAGDLLQNPTNEQLIATGFHRNTLINEEGGSDPEQFRNEAVVDRTNTTGAVWLGLTVGCAQCHTHKFDPISHHEYFQFFAFFNSGKDKNSRSPEMVAVPSNRQHERDQLLQSVADRKADLGTFKKANPDDAARIKELESSVKQAEKTLRQFDDRFGKMMIMGELNEPRKTHVLVRGDFLRKSDQVAPNTPAVLGQVAEISAVDPSELNATDAIRPEDTTTSRLDLARWLVDQRNPLTARVTVNRIWMQYFGQGIVETENDFGTQGSLPTHPQLLDWLASELIRVNWSTKAIHRLIVTSATYRQSSKIRQDLQEIDADNRLLARQARLRVTAEIVRDLSLDASGLLSNKIGGKSVYPYQPKGVYSFTQTRKRWNTSAGADRYRRGMYTFFYRSAAHPFLTTFDTPNFQTVCTSRLRSNTPLQSLTMANDQTIIDASRGLADRLLRSSKDTRQRIELAFEVCFARPPTAYETERMTRFYETQREQFESESNTKSTSNVQEIVADWFPNHSPAEAAAAVAMSRVLLNLDEFLTRE